MPSGAFGLNDTGKNALGRMGEIPNWLYGAMVDLAGKSNDATGTGKQSLDQYSWLLSQILQNYGQPGAGFFDPSQIKDYGAQVMPGVSGATSDRLSRLNTLQGQLSGVPTGQNIQDTLYGNLTGEGQYTNDMTDAMRSMLADSFSKMRGTASTGNADFNSNLKGTYDTLEQGVNDTYPYLRAASDKTFSGLGTKSDSTFGGLNDQNASLYAALVNKSGDVYGGLGGQSDALFSDLGNKTGQAYDSATTNIQRLLPGGDLRAAAAARSFAPAMAAAQRRLRTAGVDPNSPEASGILQNVDLARAHSMDDIMANSNSQYIQALNSLGLGKNNAQNQLALSGLQNRQGLKLGDLGNQQGLRQTGFGNTRDLTLGGLQNRQGLDLGAMQNEQSLAQQQEALIRSLGLDRSSQYGQSILRNMQTQMGLQQGEAAGNMGLTDTNYQRNMGIFQNRDKVAQIGRQLGLQDWEIQNMLAGQFNDANLQGIDLNTQLWNQGSAGLQRGQARQDNAMAQLGNYGQYQTGLGNTYGQEGQGAGSNAYNLYGSDLGLESQNAGWLTKLLTSFAAPALSMIPGIGPFLGAAAGGIGGGMTGGGGYGGGGSTGGYGTPPFLPFMTPKVSQPKVGSSSWNSAFDPSMFQGYGGGG